MSTDLIFFNYCLYFNFWRAFLTIKQYLFAICVEVQKMFNVFVDLWWYGADDGTSSSVILVNLKNN